MLHGRAVPRPAAWLAPLALLALAVCVVDVPGRLAVRPTTGGCRRSPSRSALLVFGLQAESPVRRALSTRPLVWLGGISYGVYLYHWPIYVIADERRTGLDGWQLVVVQLALHVGDRRDLVPSARATDPAALAARSRRMTLVTGGLATSAVAVVTLAVVPAALGEYWQTDDATVAAAAIDVDGRRSNRSRPSRSARRHLDVDVDDLAAAPTTTARGRRGAAVASPDLSATHRCRHDDRRRRRRPRPPRRPSRRCRRCRDPVRIIVAGDSTARATAAGLLAWAVEHPELAQVEVVGAPGCGFLRGGERREGGWKQPPAECDRWLDDELPARVAATQPDVVMMMVTTWDLVDHRWDDGDGLTPLDPVFASTPRRARTRPRRTSCSVSAPARSRGSCRPIPNVWWGNQGTGQEDPGTSRGAAVGDRRPGDLASRTRSA